MDNNIDIKVIQEWEEMIKSKFQEIKTASEANQFIEILQNAEGDIRHRRKDMDTQEANIANNALDLIDKHYQTVLDWLEQTPIVKN
jgi:hypothetical protein